MAAGIQQSSSRVRGRMRRRAMAEINVTPFVDVMLVLLIVFMVTAPLLTVGVPVDLPKTKAPALGQDREPLSITVGAGPSWSTKSRALSTGVRGKRSPILIVPFRRLSPISLRKSQRIPTTSTF